MMPVTSTLTPVHFVSVCYNDSKMLFLPLFMRRVGGVRVVR